MQKQFYSKKQSRKDAQVMLLPFLGIWMWKTIFYRKKKNKQQNYCTILNKLNV